MFSDNGGPSQLDTYIRWKDELIEELRAVLVALENLLQDTQHKDHDCGDEEHCPVAKAKKALQHARLYV